MKKILIGLVIGILLGLWWGVNIGKGRDFYANPFKGAQEHAKEKAGEMIDDAKKSLREKLN
jgi:hypothetical protein